MLLDGHTHVCTYHHTYVRGHENNIRHNNTLTWRCSWPHLHNCTTHQGIFWFKEYNLLEFWERNVLDIRRNNLSWSQGYVFNRGWLNYTRNIAVIWACSHTTLHMYVRTYVCTYVRTYVRMSTHVQRMLFLDSFSISPIPSNTLVISYILLFWRTSNVSAAYRTGKVWQADWITD
jgi:hypothetical protein